jgi:hypothetical protein
MKPADDAYAPHLVMVTLNVNDQPWPEHELLAEAVADALRDAGWNPVGITVHDVGDAGVL